MNYLFTFIEGILTFISPCILSMLPIYLAYIVGDHQQTKANVLRKTILFILGFSCTFIIFGILASSIGSLLIAYQQILNIVCGSIIITLGLIYLDIIPFKLHLPLNIDPNKLGAFLFGVLFSITWSPCVGAFLGSALMLATFSGLVWQGALLLLVYSCGLAIPFLILAMMIDNLKGNIKWLKDHSKLIRNISGVFLIILGIIIFFGYLTKINNFFM